MTFSETHNLGTLRELLESLANLDPSRYVIPRAKFEESALAFRDCRLELMRLESHKLSEVQLHRLQQMDYRLQMVVSGHGCASGIAPEAKQALDSFGWLGTDTNEQPSTESL